MASNYFTGLYYKGIINAQNETMENEIFHDPYVDWNSRVPRRSAKQQKWTFIRGDEFVHRPGVEAQPFALHLDEIRHVMGTTEDIQVRIEAQMTEYFYNETQHAFAEARIVTKKLTPKFLGPQPMIFKPGMPFEGQVSILFNDIIPLDIEVLYTAKLSLEFSDQNGIFETILYEPDDDLQDPFEQLSKKHHQLSFRLNGTAKFNVDIPEDSEEIQIMANIETETFGQARISGNKQF